MYKLLIVDDEPIIRQGIRQLIDFRELLISEVYEASDGNQGLKIVHDRQPDIVLADINMPNMDGLALARMIKTMNRNIRVAIITGYDYFDYALAALKAGVDDFVLKPVSKKDICELLRKLVVDIQGDEAHASVLTSLGKIQQLTNGENTDNITYKEVILRVLDQSIGDPQFSLSKLAEAVNLSKGYVGALFKQIFGIPFQEYLTAMRLERSKILLLVTSYKVYEIAERVGFDDPNYFSTSFKKRFGMSPNRYRDTRTGDLT